MTNIVGFTRRTLPSSFVVSLTNLTAIRTQHLSPLAVACVAVDSSGIALASTSLLR